MTGATPPPSTEVAVVEEGGGKKGGGKVKGGIVFEKGGENDVSNGPVAERRCTDILFLLLFILAWGGFIAIAVVAFASGNPHRLVAGQDFQGRFCGLAEDGMSEYPRLYFTLNITGLGASHGISDLLNTSYADWSSAATLRNFGQSFSSVCVKQCPTAELLEALQQPNWTRHYEYKIPNPAATVGDNKTLMTLGTFPALDREELCPYDAKHCVPVASPTMSVLGRYCIPSLATGEWGNKTLLSVSQYIPSDMLGTWTQWFGDVAIVWPVIPITVGVALLVGLIWMVLLRIAAGLLVWSCIGVIVCMFAAGGAAANIYSQDLSIEISESNRAALLYGGYVVWGLGVIFLLSIICMFKKIREGIAIVKTAAMFMYNTPTILFVPLVSFVVNLIYLVVWIIIALYLMSAVNIYDPLASKEDPTETVENNNSTLSSEETDLDDDSNSRFTWNESTQRFMGYHFFMLLWGNAFLIALNQLVLAGSVATWYFTPENEKGNKVVYGSVCKSAYTAVRYHLGSVALGSFILAAVKFVKWFLRYLASQSKVAKESPSKALEKCLPCGIGKIFRPLSAVNTSYVWILGCLSYMVLCFERCIKFLNKNAYIQIAILGKNFCKSAWASFVLVIRNPGRWAVAAGIGRTLRFLGLLSVTAVGAVVGFLLTEKMYGGEISSPVFPTILFAIISFLVGSLFMDILGMAIDTTLQCYLAGNICRTIYI
eukprot:GHVQ01001531.1.p1 GENE.GHVQ01001531.1~~GHVQ01001531.1.p1  ORF type:complete len:731 (-),score=96.12 GHVQ01001531.1:505-2640(-)